MIENKIQECMDSMLEPNAKKAKIGTSSNSDNDVGANEAIDNVDLTQESNEN